MEWKWYFGVVWGREGWVETESYDLVLGGEALHERTIASIAPHRPTNRSIQHSPKYIHMYVAQICSIILVQTSVKFHTLWRFYFYFSIFSNLYYTNNLFLSLPFHQRKEKKIGNISILIHFVCRLVTKLTNKMLTAITSISTLSLNPWCFFCPNQP